MKKILLALLCAVAASPAMALPEVPEHMHFCNIDLHLNAEARTKIAEHAGKLQGSSVHFKALVDRANIYFPFVEEAFELRGVPQDLKYIVMQESSLISDVVSSSNAVGFWQFKEASGRESGLVIDAQVDERKHIFLSSLAAAKYFYTIARYYDNYFYAVIGYNRGPVGALPFFEESGFGARKLNVTGETHWYALHALATKIAFENAVGKSDPPMWLQPLSSRGETDVAVLARAHDLSVEEFKKYNTWITGTTLPAGKDYVYYVPRQGKPQVSLLRHVGGPARLVGGPTPPTKVVEAPKPPKVVEPVKETPAPPQRDTRKFTYLEPLDDPDYGREYVRVRDRESLVEIAVHYGVKVRKLQEYNGFPGYHRPVKGDVIYLKSPSARRFHIVQPGESLAAIGEKYERTVEKLRAVNQFSGNTIYAGQKLSLKKKVPSGQKPILLALPSETEEVIPEVEVVEEEKEPAKEPRKVVEIPAGTGILQADASAYRLPAFESKMVTHTVVKGESVWKVARKYGAYAEVVKKLNNLSSNELTVGKEIKVLQVVDRN